MQTASLRPDHFKDVLGRLPPAVDLDALALETNAVERWREIKDGASLLRLALARGPGGLSLAETAGWAGLIGLAELSAPGLKYRLDKAGGFLDALVSDLLLCAMHSAPLHWPGRFLRAADGSSISERASKGVDWGVHGVFDLGRGRFSHLELSDCHGAESMVRGAPIDGEIRIGDRGFAKAGVLQRWHAQGNGRADFIVRISWRTFALTTPEGKPFSLSDHFDTLPAAAGPHEVMVLARTGPKTPPLALRLIILRKSPEATEAARAKLRKHATRQQKKLDPRTLATAEFLVLATSLPTELYLARNICAAYRLRWQIELAFKRLKSLLHIDQIPTRTQQASRSWLLTHLVLALLCDDVSQQMLESFPSGPQ
jgi:hypothetical protein